MKTEVLFIIKCPWLITDNAAMIGWNAIEILESSKNKFNNYNVGLDQIRSFMKTSKNYWLMKSEPETWSWEQQKKKKVEHWDGVRNYQAANYMKQMKKGDECLFYSSVSEKGD